MTRLLSTVRTISGIEKGKRPRFEIAIVDGWRVVVEAGKFKVGEWIVYFEVDSFLPSSDARWAHLSQRFTTLDGERGFRARMESIHGIISQRMIVPLVTFPEIRNILNDHTAKHCRSTTEQAARENSFDKVLKIKKFDTEKKDASALGPFPYLIPKTEVNRGQNKKDSLYKKWGNRVFQETTKMNGNSMTAFFIANLHPGYGHLPATHPSAMFDNGRFGICSSNIEKLVDDTCIYWRTAKQNAIPSKLASMGRSIALQGELVGYSIARNAEKLHIGFHEFFVFGA